MDRPVNVRGSRLLDLVDVMDRLRRECPWDQQQSHESLVKYLVEETYETVEAIETGDRQHLREELGDLLLQVIFHARIASEHPTDRFDIDDVAGEIVEKMIRRHPHVFTDPPAGEDRAESLSADDVHSRWERLKAHEKGRSSAVDGIPLGLPALSLADKVISRVRRASPVVEPVVKPRVEPVVEPRPVVELGVELVETVETTSDSKPVVELVKTVETTPTEPAYTTESLGEVLFALVAAASAAGLDAEQALRQRVTQEIAAVRAADQRGLASDAGQPG